MQTGWIQASRRDGLRSNLLATQSIVPHKKKQAEFKGFIKADDNIIYF